MRFLLSSTDLPTRCWSISGPDVSGKDDFDLAGSTQFAGFINETKDPIIDSALGAVGAARSSPSNGIDNRPFAPHCNRNDELAGVLANSFPTHEFTLHVYSVRHSCT